MEANVDTCLHPWRRSDRLGVPSNHILHLCIRCYVTVNKPVLSYLLLRLLPQWRPRSDCTLCIVHCTIVHSHSHVGPFVPTMRRNRTFGSASSRPSLKQQESNHKNSNMPTLLPACQSKSFRTLWILLMSAATQMRPSTF
jgi:hypothetical protein